MARYWILQGNPDVYRIFDALGDAGAVRTWKIARYRHDILRGHEFALQATCTAESGRKLSAAREYWLWHGFREVFLIVSRRGGRGGGAGRDWPGHTSGA